MRCYSLLEKKYLTKLLLLIHGKITLGVLWIPCIKKPSKTGTKVHQTSSWDGVGEIEQSGFKFPHIQGGDLIETKLFKLLDIEVAVQFQICV